jgi:hypothetical protein
LNSSAIFGIFSAEFEVFSRTLWGGLEIVVKAGQTVLRAFAGFGTPVGQLSQATMHRHAVFWAAILLICEGASGGSEKVESAAHSGTGSTMQIPVSKLPYSLQHIIQNNLHRAAIKGDVDGPKIIPATSSSPAMICSSVIGQAGEPPGLLCKPIPASNGTSPQDVEAAGKAVKELAADVAHQAKILGAPLRPASLHMAPAVYMWKDSSTFVFVSNKRHYYNVHYADSSALKIKTGQDIVQLGPYHVITRFGLIEEAVSGENILLLCTHTHTHKTHKHTHKHTRIHTYTHTHHTYRTTWGGLTEGRMDS